MSDPTPVNTSNGGGPIPAWMKTVDEETLYDAESTDGAEGRPPEKASAESPAVSSADDANPDDPSIASDATSLGQELALSMADPSDMPTPDPDLQPTPVGRVRADLDRQLTKAVSVLSARYEADLSRSLLLEFSLRRTLLQLREQGEESTLVQWLDAELMRH